MGEDSAPKRQDAPGDRRVLKFEAAGWKLADRERRLYNEAPGIPTWRLANQARRLLASYTHQLSLSIPVPDASEIPDLDAISARQLASINLAMVAIRHTGCVLSLIGTGYEPEALVHARSILEAQYRARQVSDDASGEAARRVLQGRPQVSLKKLANRYGDQREIELLDHFAHADVRQLLVLAPGVTSPLAPGVTSPLAPGVTSPLAPGVTSPLEVESEVLIDIRPTRGVLRPAHQLYAAAHTATSISTVLAEVFGVTVMIPGWISGQLLHYRDHPLPDVL